MGAAMRTGVGMSTGPVWGSAWRPARSDSRMSTRVTMPLPELGTLHVAPACSIVSNMRRRAMATRATTSRTRMTAPALPALLAMLLMLLLMLAPAPAPAQEARLEAFLPTLGPGEVVPGADRFGPVASSPAIVAPAYRGDELVGHAFLTSQYVNTAGYSGKPIHIVVGLDNEGTIVGLKLVAHSEPIVLIGIPEKRVIDYMAAFVGYNPMKAAMAGEGMPRTDIVSGATVTVLVMGESVVRASIRVARALGLGGAPAAAQAAVARELD